MSSFNTHITGGVVVATIASGISYISFELNIIQVFAVFVMTVLSSIIPDLDSDSGKPITLISGVLSVLLPALLLNTLFQEEPILPELLISYFTLSYLFINYVACEIIKRITIHRGIMHSIPFSILSAQISYILFLPSGQTMAIVVAIATFVGCLTHLILDELNAFYLKFGFIPMLKNSSGTALKLYSKNIMVNIFVYVLVLALVLIIIIQ